MSEGNGYVTREALLGTPIGRRFKDVEIEGHKFRLRSLNDLEKSEFEAQALNSKGQFNRRAAWTANARLAVLCCVNGNGEQLFSCDDVKKLQSLDSGFMDKLSRACREHCGFEEPEKNFDTTDDADSPTS